ncbi:MAG: hypothetical protein GPI92_07420 [Microcystis aeruginosa K13-06]|nr:hypothetical protein [Microcystis aeruginosa K13-06]
MSNETVTYSLEAVLTRIEGKIDKIDERLTKVEIGQSELKGEIKALGFKQGFRGLILPLIVGGISAGIGAIITVSIRFSLLGGNP